MPPWLKALLTRAAWRRVPWAVVLQGAVWLFRQGRHRLERLTPPQRRELLDLIRKSRGRPANLTARQQERVRALVRKALLD
jgi:hypothetical protein